MTSASHPQPPLTILFRDERYVVIDKPEGLAVHRSGQVHDEVVCQTLLRDQLGTSVHPVHRLDRKTSGVLIFAFDKEALAEAQRCFATRRTRKRYLALVRGWMPADTTIRRPLADAGGGTPLEASTRLRQLARSSHPAPWQRYPSTRFSLCLAEPETGRWHQIRQHLVDLHCPVIGDSTHGDTRFNRHFRELFGLDRMFLHAASLELEHPFTGTHLRLSSPLAGDFLDFCSVHGMPTTLPAD